MSIFDNNTQTTSGVGGVYMFTMSCINVNCLGTAGKRRMMGNMFEASLYNRQKIYLCQKSVWETLTITHAILCGISVKV